MTGGMRIALDGKHVAMIGDAGPLAVELRRALAAQGAVLDAPDAGAPDVAVLSLPLDPAAGFDWAGPERRLRAIGAAMRDRGQGRIVFVMSALALVPMRRHAAFSADMARALAVLRGMAMDLAPQVCVNGVGAGLIGDPALSGDAVMAGHVALGRPGSAAEICNAVLFLCDPANSYLTGQILAVDGGWSIGYARNF